MQLLTVSEQALPASLELPLLALRDNRGLQDRVRGSSTKGSRARGAFPWKEAGPMYYHAVLCPHLALHTAQPTPAVAYCCFAVQQCVLRSCGCCCCPKAPCATLGAAATHSVLQAPIVPQR